MMDYIRTPKKMKYNLITVCVRLFIVAAVIVVIVVFLKKKKKTSTKTNLVISSWGLGLSDESFTREVCWE